MEVCKKYLTHDPENSTSRSTQFRPVKSANIHYNWLRQKKVLRKDDKVVIQNCPPISARKRFKLHKILRSPEGELEAKHAKEAQQQEKGTRSTAS